jgi:hypothetical protein
VQRFFKRIFMQELYVFFNNSAFIAYKNCTVFRFCTQSSFLVHTHWYLFSIRFRSLQMYGDVKIWSHSRRCYECPETKMFTISFASNLHEWITTISHCCWLTECDNLGFRCEFLLPRFGLYRGVIFGFCYRKFRISSVWLLMSAVIFFPFQG